VGTLLIAVGAGCGATKAAAPKVTTTIAAPTTTSTTVEAGFTRFTDAADHFTIDVPTSWIRVDPSNPAANQALQAELNANPQLKAEYGSGSLATSNTKFLAIDKVASGSQHPQLNIIVEPAPGVTDSDLATAAAPLTAEYKKAGITVTGSSTTTVAGHQALHLRLLAQLKNLSGNPATVLESQDIVGANDEIYILTFAGSTPDFASMETSFSVS
jgi:hypothetical protein